MQLPFYILADPSKLQRDPTGLVRIVDGAAIQTVSNDGELCVPVFSNVNTAGRFACEHGLVGFEALEISNDFDFVSIFGQLRFHGYKRIIIDLADADMPVRFVSLDRELAVAQSRMGA